MSWGSVELRYVRGIAPRNLDAFDFTKMTAINTCPKWGIVRYAKHKVMHGPGEGRAMALEAGKAMHECFAALRLYSLLIQHHKPDLFAYHAKRLFGNIEGLANELILIASHPGGDDVSRARNFCLAVLEAQGYQDDPMDKRRTYSNLEAALLYYIQRWDFRRYPVWVRDVEDTTSDVGIELPFAVHVTGTGDKSVREFLFTGRIDGIHTNGFGGELIAQENKTASRLGPAWYMSWHTSHQVSGYLMAASLYSEAPVRRAQVVGLTLPLAREMYNSMHIEDVRRTDEQLQSWLEWVEHTVLMHDANIDNPVDAPMYTHSCNRYFRPCSLIPMCASPKDEQRDMLNEMHTDEWSPLDEVSTGD